MSGSEGEEGARGLLGKSVVVEDGCERGRGAARDHRARIGATGARRPGS